MRADVSQGVVSLIERGRIDLVSLDKVRRVARELDADLVMQLRWRGGDLDRLLDEGHAALAGRIVELLQELAWQVRTEVSYSEYGERGSIDILAWHTPTRALLVIEIKTELVSIEETLRKHDEKTRLSLKVAREQFGWHALTTSRVLVLPDLRTPRRRVERHAPVLSAAYPARGTALRSWLRNPNAAISGLLFVAPRVGSATISRKHGKCRPTARSGRLAT